MLDVNGLFAGYGTLPVLRDVSFRVDQGEILLIVGENGAGKSTLLRAIAGLIRPSAGEVHLEGQPITGLLPEDIVRRGLRLVLDGHQVFPELTVLDNLRLGAAARKSSKQAFDRDVEEVSGVFPVLKEKLHDRARDLSGGQQQMLALAQAFVVRPEVLLCDEPSTGLAMALMPPIMSFLRDWARRGTSIIVVEQHIELALETADRALFMERGAVKLSCRAADFRSELSTALSAKRASASSAAP